MNMYQSEPTVILLCTNERVPQKDVEFLDIEETFFGDQLRFVCCMCGDIHVSLIYL